MRTAAMIITILSAIGFFVLMGWTKAGPITTPLMVVLLSNCFVFGIILFGIFISEPV